jgi:hypothetical protein
LTKNSCKTHYPGNLYIVLKNSDHEYWKIYLENVHEYLIIILIKIKDIIMYNIILLPVFPGHEFLHIITDHLKMSLYSESRLQTETGINQNLVLMKLQKNAFNSYL